MNPVSCVPPFLHYLGALVVLAEGLVLVAWHARQAERLRPAAAPLVAAFLSVWFAGAFVLADSAHFPLPREELRLPLSGLVSFGPFLLALLWALGSRAGRAINTAMVPAALIGVQVYRVAGILFLYPNLAYGVLPGGFAWPAGVGDVLTGLAAPVVAWPSLAAAPARCGLPSPGTSSACWTSSWRRRPRRSSMPRSSRSSRSTSSPSLWGRRWGS